MKLNSVTRFLVEKLLKMTDTDDVYKFLESRGFDIIGKGSESTVYSRKGYEYVIKIQRNYCYVKVKYVPCDKHFANQEYFHGKGFNVIVQEKCEKFSAGEWPFDNSNILYKRWMKFAKFLNDKFNVYDTHAFNMGIKNGRLVSIDWNH